MRKTSSSRSARRAGQISLAVLVVALLPSMALAASNNVSGGLVSDSTEVAATLSRFHAALAAGDSATVLTLLSPDLQVLESGGIESLGDYRAHHLAADIEFARTVPSTRKLVRLTVQGDVAWVVSESTTQGQSAGRTINSVGAELAVLRRGTTGWRIVAIHWSSRNRRSPPAH